MSAAKLLGLNDDGDDGGDEYNVEKQVDQYLGDCEKGTGILEIWQVTCSIFHEFFIAQRVTGISAKI